MRCIFIDADDLFEEFREPLNIIYYPSRNIEKNKADRVFEHTDSIMLKTGKVAVYKRIS